MTSPLKAIRQKCLDCCCNSRKEVNLCPCTDCTLWPFRFGKRPQKTNDIGFVEFKPRRKPGAVFGVRTADWATVVYVFDRGDTYKVLDERFNKTEQGLEQAKQKAREEIRKEN